MYCIVYFFVVISTYGAALCVVGSGTRLTLHRGARQRLSEAFRPKTQQCYHMLFRTFVGFCLCLSLNISKITSDDALSYLEYLATNNVSVNSQSQSWGFTSRSTICQYDSKPRLCSQSQFCYSWP